MRSICLLTCLVTTLALAVASAADLANREARKAEQVYNASVAAAGREYVKSLERVLQKTKDAAEIVAITKAIDNANKSSGLAGSAQRGPFTQEIVNESEVLFMHSRGSIVLRLAQDGRVVPAQANEHFWRIVNGNLEFVAADRQTATTRWHAVVEASGKLYACSTFIKDPSSPHILVFLLRQK